MPYREGSINSPYGLPLLKSADECEVALELAGPGKIEGQTVMLIPDVIRGLAALVIQNCLVEWGGVGGFVTEGFANMVNHVTAPDANLNSPYPPSSSFVTLTVSNIAGDPSPGGYDSQIPIKLGQHLRDKLVNSKGKSSTAPSYEEFFMRAAIMEQEGGGGQEPWWTSRQHTDDMTYECDAHLGSPRVVDCGKLEFSQLGASSDTVRISAGAPKVLATGGCHIAISASIAAVITWGGIKAALEMLIGLCVANPRQSSVGGKAYYGHHIVPGARSKRASAISGLNALPKHVNVTVYEQGRFTP
ncbi:MAG: hypothetical protein Q9187_004893 [Circinaria calcarea]